MSINIKVLGLLLFLAIFSACNNANQPQEEMTEVSTDTPPTMSAKQQAILDVQEKKTVIASMDAESMPNEVRNASLKSDTKERSRGNTSISSDKITDSEGNKIRPVPSSAPQTDVERLRQQLQQQNDAAAGKVVVAPSAPATAVQTSNRTAQNVKNSKVQTPVAQNTVPAAEEMAQPDHTVWNSLLSQNVSSTGKVNYQGLRSSQAKLEAYLQELKSNPPTSDWKRNEKMAYWINAYNAFTVKKILDNYPVKSITDLSGGKVWDDKWINIGNKTYSLNDIENGILRPTYKDARIHFAVNCAAQSCPPLHNRAFTADNLESTLARLTKKFINNSKYNTITANEVKVSKIFDWYKEDFGNLVSYLNKYSDTDINSNASVNYTEYDWSLND